MGALEIAEITLYVILIFPATYCLFKHGGRGILGWFYLFAFCAIRIVGNSMLLHDENEGTISIAALIISGLGIAPLLLASIGILHEGRRARIHRLGGWREWFLNIQFHTLLAVGIALVAVGVDKLYSIPPSSDAHTLLDVGLAILDLCWALLACWTVVSAIPSRRCDAKGVAFGDGTKLLYAVLASLPLTCLRVIYATIYYASNSSTVQHRLALKVCLGVVPELLVAVLFIVVGVLTRDMSRSIEQEKRPSGPGDMVYA